MNAEKGKAVRQMFGRRDKMRLRGNVLQWGDVGKNELT